MKRFTEITSARREAEPRGLGEYISGRRSWKLSFSIRKTNHTIKYYTQAYRSGHNEAVLKTVRGNPTGVRIPQPAPKKKAPSRCFFLWDWLRFERNPSAERKGVRLSRAERRLLARRRQARTTSVKREPPSACATCLGIRLNSKAFFFALSLSFNNTFHFILNAPFCWVTHNIPQKREKVQLFITVSGNLN